MMTARKVLEPEGKWTAAREEVLAICKGPNELELPALRTSAEYLLTTVRPGV